MRSLPFTVVSLLVALAFPAAADEAFHARMASVEAIRGRSFSSAVARKTLARDTLREFLREQIDRDLPHGADGYLDALKAVGLVDDDVTIEPLLDLYDAQVLAFYDPATHVYYALDAPPENVSMPTAMLEAIEIHELMHAMQDQAFDAGRRTIELQSDWDAALAYQSLLEGEATLVMLAHLGRTAGLDIATMLAEEGMVEALRDAAAQGGTIPKGVPGYFVESLQFPYVDGLAFVLDLFKTGGWKSLDAVHVNPPVSTEEILRPAVYRERIAREQSDARPAEEPTEAELVRTVLGEFHWRFLLGAKAGEGWNSDRVVVQRGKRGLTVLVESSWDSATDAREFAAAIEPMLERKKAKNARVRLSGTRVFAGWGHDTAAIKALVKTK